MNSAQPVLLIAALLCSPACSDPPNALQADANSADAAEEFDTAEEPETTEEPDTRLDAESDMRDPPEPGLQLVIHDVGAIDLVGVNDAREERLFIRAARAEVRYEVGRREHVLSSATCEGTWEPVPQAASTHAYFAGSTGQRFNCLGDHLQLVWTVHVDRNRNTAIAQVEVENLSGGDLVITQFSPVVSTGPEGGLFVGDDMAAHRVLDNGSDLVNDVNVLLHYPEERRNPLARALFETEARGEIVSNWNHAVVDIEGGRSWVAGALSVERSIPSFGVSESDRHETIDEASGRQGFDAFYADLGLYWQGKTLSDGGTLASEAIYLAPMAADPWTGLEDYADAVAAWLDFTVWTRRGDGRPVPNGWNSWTGSGSTGGLGTNINETLMAEELAVMAREFAPFGVDYFQIDDGYQIAEGDWEPRDDRFPSGIPALSQRIRAEGLIPGIWISGFLARVDSSLATDHPDWLQPPEGNITAGLLDPGESLRALDLSNSEVISWLTDTMTRYRDDWDMGWIKLDFAYHAALFSPRADPTMTAMEAYRQGVMAVRDALGDDVFYMGIGLMGVNYGVVDAMRLTLDNGPLWEEADPFDLFGDGNTFKNGVRVGARRYYLHNRVWINHNDLLFFRTDPSHPEPPITLEEATTLASFMGLSGAIVKFGEDLRTLTPEQINIWRRLLPIYPAGARPMDLFLRAYPEQYHLVIDGTSQGHDASWHVVGLLNWGRNYDYSSPSRATLIDDESRDYAVNLTDWGLDPETTYLAHEFWREEFVGEVRGVLEHTVPAHGHAVLSLREASGVPQFLGHNRHFTQGGTDLIAETWDDAAGRLALDLAVDAGGADAVPFEYRVRFYLPDDFEPARLDDALGTWTRDGDVLTLTFTPTAPGTIEIVIPFE